MRIAIVQGHPDPAGGHFGHALADAYIKGAEAGGHEVRRIDVAKLPFDVVRSKSEWESALPAQSIRSAYKDLVWAEHIVILFPLWLGTMPALLKAFLNRSFARALSATEKRPQFGRNRSKDAAAGSL